MSVSAVHIDRLSVRYGRTPAISEVSLDVEDGEFLGIIGPNGGGKSTLLKAILGLVPVTYGEVRIYGVSIGRTRATVGYVPQLAGMDKQFPITAREVVMTGRLNRHLIPFFGYSGRDRAAVDALLDQVGIRSLANRQIAGLSGGEFQKMLIARALAAEPRLLLLDEPTASVDAASREQIHSLLKELNKSMTVILVSHDLLAISSHVRKLACLNTSLVYHGEPELTEKIVSDLYGCPVDLLAHGVPHRVLKEHEEGRGHA